MSIKSAKILITLLVILFTTNVIAASNGADEIKDIAEKSKNIISRVRIGDFSHIGGTRALNIMLGELNNINQDVRSGNVLEVGSGYGGSADYIYQNGFDNIWGIDIKPSAVDHASTKYSDIKFRAADILDIADEFDEDFFSLVYSINTISNIHDQNNLWQEIKNVSHRGAILAVMDYYVEEIPEVPVLLKPNSSVRYPIPLKDTKKVMEYIGWDIIAEKDITHDFKQWHLDMVNKINKRYELLVSSGFSSREIEYVLDYYKNIVSLMDEKKVGGIILIARKI